MTTFERLEDVLDAALATVVAALCAWVIFELWDTNFIAIGIAIDIFTALS